MEKYIDDFHEGIRTDFPYMNPGQTSVSKITVNPSSGKLERIDQVEKSWEFLGLNKDYSIVLTKDFLVLLSVREGYQRIGKWGGFLKKTIDGLKAVANNAGVFYVTRVGLRYIDVVEESESRSHYDVLKPELLVGQKLSHAVGVDQADFDHVRQHWTMGDGIQMTLQTRVAKNIPVNEGIDLYSIKQGPDLSPKERFVSADFDCYRAFDPGIAFDTQNMESLLEQLHKKHRIAFRSVFNFTDKEIQSWK